MGGKRHQLKGRRFGMLKVLRFIGKRESAAFGRPGWLCRCDCGGQKVYDSRMLAVGKAKTCGCASRKLISETLKTHGQSDTALYRRYRTMLARCHNPRHDSYHKYGAVGVKVCQKWRESFATFLADVGHPPTPQHTLDRYPNRKGDYEPGNVRWATLGEQNNNKATNRRILYENRDLTLAQWSRELNAFPETVSGWLKRFGGDMAAVVAFASTHVSRPRVGLTHQGRTQFASDWAKEWGVPPNTVRQWVKRYGGDMEKVVTAKQRWQPLDNKKHLKK